MKVFVNSFSICYIIRDIKQSKQEVKRASQCGSYLEGNPGPFQKGTKETGGKVNSHQLRIEDEEQKDLFTWKEMYGMGKGVWNIEAQDYVNQLREDRS